MSKLQARNETIINAPISAVWAIITDINLLPKINQESFPQLDVWTSKEKQELAK